MGGIIKCITYRTAGWFAILTCPLEELKPQDWEEKEMNIAVISSAMKKQFVLNCRLLF